MAPSACSGPPTCTSARPSTASSDLRHVHEIAMGDVHADDTRVLVEQLRPSERGFVVVADRLVGRQHEVAGRVVEHGAEVRALLVGVGHVPVTEVERVHLRRVDARMRPRPRPARTTSAAVRGSTPIARTGTRARELLGTDVEHAPALVAGQRVALAAAAPGQVHADPGRRRGARRCARSPASSSVAVLGERCEADDERAVARRRSRPRTLRGAGSAGRGAPPVGWISCPSAPVRRTG